MLRKIIKIDKEKCNGCGLCVNACHEGAIGLENGKAMLMREDYCDGLGNCLPACPTGAITFEEREAEAFNEEAVKITKAEQEKPLPCGCPGTQSRTFSKEKAERIEENTPTVANTRESPSELGQWPCQIKLVPVNAPYFKGANLLIAADCAAYAYGNFHNRFMKNKITIIGCPKLDEGDYWPCQIKLVPINAPYLNGANLLIAADCAAYAYGNFHSRFMKNKITIIGCPKLDEGDYAEKLTAILKMNDIKSVTVVRMEVPCCGGLSNAAVQSLRDCGKMIPWNVVTISVDGNIIE